MPTSTSSPRKSSDSEGRVFWRPALPPLGDFVDQDEFVVKWQTPCEAGKEKTIWFEGEDQLRTELTQLLEEHLKATRPHQAAWIDEEHITQKLLYSPERACEFTGRYRIFFYLLPADSADAES